MLPLERPCEFGLAHGFGYQSSKLAGVYLSVLGPEHGFTLNCC